jgi:hypothetical protein
MLRICALNRSTIDAASARARLIAVDAEHLVDGVHEAADAGDLRRRQHRHDAKDRDGVGDRGDHRALGNRAGHVALGVLHLLGRAVLQLEADVVEEEHRHERDEQRVGRREVAGRRHAQAVLERVDDRRDREQAGRVVECGGAKSKCRTGVGGCFLQAIQIRFERMNRGLRDGGACSECYHCQKSCDRFHERRR